MGEAPGQAPVARRGKHQKTMFEVLLMSGSERQQKAFALNYCAGAFVTEGTLLPLMAFVLMCPTELLLTPAQGRALTSKAT